jgi:hypothetical protein
MAGGLLQLLAWGSQNIKLNGNPSMTYFKRVYKAHTNFSMESIQINLNRTDFNVDKSTIFKIKIPRQGDLVQQIYFVFELPDIVCDNQYQFKWIEHLGEAIIDNYYITMGGALIDRQYGEFLHVANSLALSPSKRVMYDKMIGNVKELTDPAFSGTYPFSSLGAAPSIPSRKIVVPLNFWFNRTSGSALPIVSMQYSEAEITIEVRPLNQLYKLFYNGKYRSPEQGVDDHKLHNFVSNTINTYMRSETVCDLKASLEANYYFVDEKEREYIVYRNLEYLVEQTVRIERFNISTNNIFELVLQNPVKEILWVLRRSDAGRMNDWFNFQDNGRPIMKSAQILFNGDARISEKGEWYFGQVQPYQHHTAQKDGVYVYSFAIEPEEFQPSGSCNMSRLQKVQLALKANVPLDNSYTYDLAIYVINYNFVKIVSGLAGIVFST